MRSQANQKKGEKKMTRKTFLQTVAGAAAGAAVLRSPALAQAGGPRLRRGVSFYSYQAAYFSGQMTVEDCVAEAGCIGARGLEIIADAMIPNYPKPPDAWVERWHGWMKKYNTVPVNYCQSQDTTINPKHVLTASEGAERLTNDIVCANRLGFTQMRLLGATPLPVVERSVPAAEKYNVNLNFEIHGPNPIDGKLVETWVNFFEKVNSPKVGLNPDFSLWEKRPNRVMRDQQIRAGLMRPEVASYIEQACADGVPQQSAVAQVEHMGGSRHELDYVNRRYMGFQDPKKLLPLKKYVHHMHAKCYETTEDYQESCIAYEEVIPLLTEHGFDLYMTTEYEGQRFVMDAHEEDEVEQVRRHQLLLKRLGVA